MEVKAVAKYLRVQPRKVRIIADEVRGKSAPFASALLRHHSSKSARLLRKVLESAMANASENNGLAKESLVISQIMIDAGPRLKRMRARAQGRGARIEKKTSHITVVVEDQEAKAAVKPHGTKAKARPTFTTGKGKKAQGPTISAKAAKPEAAEEPVVETTEAAVENTAASNVEEATPVEVSEAPEEAGSASDEADKNVGGPGDEEENKENS